MRAELNGVVLPRAGRRLRTFMVATVLLTGALSGLVVGRASVRPQPVSSSTGRGLPADLRAAIRWDRHNCPAPAHPDANIC
jgi:hypothetical protein